jgi:hypothetical protein
MSKADTGGVEEAVPKAAVTGETVEATLLGPVELREYRYALSMLEEQKNRLGEARLGVERAEFLAAAADDRCANCGRRYARPTA